MKAILVIDMPTNCRGCDKLVRKGCLKGDYRKDERPKQCPLKEMPQKMAVRDELSDKYGLDDNEYCVGYNACIDEIVGEEEK